MMERYQSDLHIRFQDADYKNKEDNKNSDNTKNTDDMIMIYRCILVEDNKSIISKNVKRLTISVRSDNMDIYFPLVINGIRAIPETIEEISIELSKKSNGKKLFMNDLIIDGLIH